MTWGKDGALRVLMYYYDRTTGHPVATPYCRRWDHAGGHRRGHIDEGSCRALKTKEEKSKDEPKET